MTTIPFNKPFLAGKELTHIADSVASGKISGDGIFTKKCHAFFEERFGFQKVLLTTSCTDALELAAILCNIEAGDEIICPSYTFVSTVNAFVLRGAKIIFADSDPNTPNIDVSKIEALITPNTKAIVPVHYAGVACDMDPIIALAKKYNLFVIEDAAQGIDSFYKGRPLGSIGHFAAFSFHETKNIISGEGGMLTIRDSSFNNRAEIIREKGTNRSQFFRGEVDKYSWVDIGSSFLPSDIIAAYLYGQLEALDNIQEKRKSIWNYYYENLKTLQNKGQCKLPYIPEYATNNGHMFHLLCNSLEERTLLIKHLKEKNIMAVFHYLSLHKSSYITNLTGTQSTDLSQADRYSDTLVRLPFFYELTEKELSYICTSIIEFYS